MEIIVEKSKNNITRLEPKLGDIFVANSGTHYMLVWTEDGLSYCSMGCAVYLFKPTLTRLGAFERLELNAEDAIIVGENYFPADQIALSIKPIGGAWHGTF